MTTIDTDSTDRGWQHREQHILSELRRGERHNLGQLIDRYGEDLMSYLCAIVGRRELAEDVFQDTWVRVMERIDRFDPRWRFAPWLFRVARNRAYDCLRRRKYWGLPMFRSDDADAPAPEPAAPGDFSERLLARDMAEALLAGLDPVHRELVWLRFFREMSYQEIAEHCRIPMGTVKSRLARALDRVARRYQEMEGEAHV
ncbi:MAG: RNA polymerase sigma factor [bacterium]|nr:RNA polymerase sigma factor [bacterium]